MKNEGTKISFNWSNVQNVPLQLWCPLCYLWKLRTDLWTVSSGRSFQRTCTAIFGSAM